MKDKIAGNSGDTGKMYTELVVFIVGCIPVILCAICFGLAGWTYITEGETNFMHRLMVVGSILGGVSFMFIVAGAMACKHETVEDKDEVLPD